MAKNKMGACMSEWKDNHPQGRANKKMNKKSAHKQAIAACLNKTGLGEGLSFKNFLSEMEGMTTRDYIRALPLYQEMVKDPQTKPAAIKLAMSFVNEFGEQAANAQIQSYIASEFDDLYSNSAGQGADIGDWKGEEKYMSKLQHQKDAAAAVNKWEQETGMNAETGRATAPHDSRGRLRHGARTGMDFRSDIKAKRAAQDLLGQGAKGARDANVMQNRAASAPAGEDAYVGGESKADRARNIVAEMINTSRPAEIKKRLRDELDMTAAGANTYFYKMKKQALAAANS